MLHFVPTVERYSKVQLQFVNYLSSVHTKYICFLTRLLPHLVIDPVEKSRHYRDNGGP